MIYHIEAKINYNLIQDKLEALLPLECRMPSCAPAST